MPAAAYQYDANGRLKTVTFSNGSQVTYNYDENGNRTSLVEVMDTCGCLVWKGQWDNSTIYSIDNLVEHNGSTYIAITDNSGSQPPSANWELVAQKGTTGQKGLVWKGAWNTTTQYAIDEAVTYNGSSYIAIAGNLNDPPPSANWNILATKGDPGAKGLVWKGAWNSATQYAIDEGVTHNGASYIAVAINQNDPPPSANWNTLAAKGEQGQQGEQGPPGPGGASGDVSLAHLRVALTADDPWGETNVTNGGTLFIKYVYSRKIGIWNGSSTDMKTAGQFSVSLSGLSAGCYRLYVYDSSADGVVDSGLLAAWTNDSTPPSDTLVSDGYYVKTGDTSKRAVTDIMLHATGQCDWSNSRKGICHLDPRMRQPERLTALPSATWTCPRNTTSWRRVNNGSTVGEHFVEFILSEKAMVKAAAMVCATKGGGGSGDYQYQSGFGINSTTTVSATQHFGVDQSLISLDDLVSAALSKYEEKTALGKITLSLLERNTSGRDASLRVSGTVFQSGMIVEVAL